MIRNKFRMEFIKSKKIDLQGKLLVSIPSEGCLGQRVVDQILSNNKCLEFVGSFHHSSLQVKSHAVLTRPSDSPHFFIG